MKKEEFRKLVKEQLKLIISESTPTRQLIPGDAVVITNNEYQGGQAEFVGYESVKVKVDGQEVVIPFSDIETVVNEGKNKKYGSK